jgi:hypothetical protein
MKGDELIPFDTRMRHQCPPSTDAARFALFAAIQASKQTGVVDAHDNRVRLPLKETGMAKDNQSVHHLSEDHKVIDALMRRGMINGIDTRLIV